MIRAPFACDPANSRGRLVPTPPSAGRSDFQRDRDRIIHASAFRRLKHKTQVFVSPEGDHYRTRLTHSLEVAQIARTIARVLLVDEDLTEALALAHDLGHTAFGHAGEDALHARMIKFGGFDHNAQGLRIVTVLEQRHIGFDGLNLTWETLEGLVKHNGPLLVPGRTLEELPWAIRTYNERQDLWLGSFAGLEAQVAAISDDIAYNAHDLDDGLRARLFSVEDALTVPVIAELFRDVQRRAPTATVARQIAEVVRDLIGRMVADVISQTQENLRELAPASADAVRYAGKTLVTFSDAVWEQVRTIKSFLRTHMYLEARLQRRSDLAERVISGLFDAYMETPSHMPLDWARQVQNVSMDEKARCIADFIAGMTDRYALTAYENLHGPLPKDLEPKDVQENGLTI